MQEIIYSEDRLDGARLVLESNGFRYQADHKWAKWALEMIRNSVMDAYCAPDDTMYVAMDDKERPIIILDRDGRYVRSIGQGLFQKPHGITVTPNGTILCADSGMDAHVVHELQPDGTLVRTYGTPGMPSDTGYDIPTAKAMLKDRSKPHDDRIRGMLELITRRAEPFCRPTEMIQLGSGEYFASDGYGNAAVHKFDAQGNYMSSWGAPGHGPGQFYLVHGIRADDRGRLWVADRENSRVQLFRTDGTLLAILSGGFNLVSSLCFDGTYMYVGEQGGFSVIDMDLRLVARIGDGGKLMRCHGLTVDSSGNLYVCSHNSGYGGQNLLKLKRV